MEVVATGAKLFQESAARAEEVDGGAEARLEALVSGHLDVVLDNLDEVRTFLNEASALEPEYRDRVIAARDRYEDSFRRCSQQGVDDGVFRRTVDPKLGAIFILSILNAVERWFRPDGELDRRGLADEMIDLRPRRDRLRLNRAFQTVRRRPTTSSKVASVPGIAPRSRETWPCRWRATAHPRQPPPSLFGARLRSSAISPKISPLSSVLTRLPSAMMSYRPASIT